MKRIMNRVLGLIGFLWFTGCTPEPPLHLFDGGDVTINLPMVKLELDTYWDYTTIYGQYNWRDEWYYGWDEADQRLFGNIGYNEPDIYLLRRYYTGSEPMGTHTSVLSNSIRGNTFRGRYNWGFWDILVWNDVTTPDGVQSLNFDEQTSLEYVRAYTNQSMTTSRYNTPRFTRAFYEPEELVGKTCVAITNLPPRPMMGIDSCGMLLSAIHHENGEEKLHLLMLDPHIPAGAKLY
jgi:hypothetical protein